MNRITMRGIEETDLMKIYYQKIRRDMNINLIK